MKKIVLTFGIIGGLVVTVMMILGMSLVDGQTINFDDAELLGYVSIVAALSTVFIGVRSYREQHSGGTISFGKAFLIGLYITMVASVFYVGGWMIYSSNNPEFMDAYFEYSVDQLKNSGESPEEIEKKIDRMNEQREMFKNPLLQIVIAFMEIFSVGLIIALISALILKRKEKPVVT